MPPASYRPRPGAPGSPRRRDGLTQRQADWLLYFLAHVCAVGRPPTYRHLCRHFGVTPNGVSWHLHALARQGWLALEYDGRRVQTVPRVAGCTYRHAGGGRLAVACDSTPQGWRLAGLLWGGIGLPEGAPCRPV